ncbi:SMI1/KNR4 family protein [Halalkalibacter lacteus]|uniref:SMI1/KNR4 family protein n=1 Tax=Halalkalibacter lacteus TaxID=3090663 RepID=UPI002FC5AA2A
MLGLLRQNNTIDYMEEIGEIKPLGNSLREGDNKMDYKEEILKFLEKYKSYGFKTLKNQTILINRHNENGVEDWKHIIYHPLDKQGIDLLEKERNKSLPLKYKEFLSYCNGCYLFNGNFYIYGKAFLEKGMSREEMLYQPYDLIEESEDPPCKIFDDLFYIGGTPETIFVLAIDESVVELKRRSGKLVSSYESFDSWLTKKLRTTEMLSFHE